MDEETLILEDVAELMQIQPQAVARIKVLPLSKWAGSGVSATEIS